jgi:hypothetical protein
MLLIAPASMAFSAAVASRRRVWMRSAFLNVSGWVTSKRTRNSDALSLLVGGGDGQPYLRAAMRGSRSAG